MATNFGPPHMEGGTTEQLAQIRSYLHKLADELNYQFSRVERGLVHGGEGGNSGNTLEAGGNGLSARLAITEQGLAAEVQNRQNADNALDSQLSIQAGQIAAKVSSTGGSASSFAYILTDTLFKLISGYTDVFVADSSGVEVNGSVRSSDSSGNTVYISDGQIDATSVGGGTGVQLYGKQNSSGEFGLRVYKTSTSGGTPTISVNGYGAKMEVNGNKVLVDGDTIHATTSDFATNAYSCNSASYAEYIGTSSKHCELGPSSFKPDSDNYLSLGRPSTRWTTVYAASGTVETSDARKKGNIQPLTEQHLNFIKRIAPKSFTFTDGESGRTHIGFIAQEVEEAMEECGLTSLDFAGFIKSPVYALDAEGKETDEVIDYAYGLRYTEFIALVTYAWQETDRKLDNLIDTLTQKGVI